MKQFRLVSSAIVSTLLFSSVAFAHVSFKDELMAVSPEFYNWTGFYAGLNAGIVNHTMNITDNSAASFLATIQQVSNPRFTGGLQLGYRRQIDFTKVSGVYGVEGSVDFSDAQFSKEYGSPFALYQLSSENELKTVCLLEFLGGIAADRTLFFMTAGLSWVNISGTTTNLDTIAFFNGFSVAQKELGTAIGGGIEYAFTDKLSARLKIDVITPNTYTTNDNVGNSYLISNSIVQSTLGINYKFA